MTKKKVAGGAGCLVLIVLCTSAADARASEPELIAAIKAGDRGAARTLLSRTKNADVAEADGTTALHWAARSDDLQLVQQLLRAGANPSAANRYGVEPIMLAAMNGNAVIVDTLLRAGADPNASLPEDGATTLMMAARTGQPDVVKELLVYGADPNGRESAYGETALIWAAEENNAAAIEQLVKGGADLDARSAQTHFQGPRAGQSVLPRGGWTPLMYAARQGAFVAARTLADDGASLDLTGPDGVTALVLAIVNVHYGVAAMLLQEGADPNVADQTGMAALYAVVDMNTLPWAHGRPRPRPEEDLDALGMTRILLANGAKVNATLSAPKPQRQHTAGDPGLGAGATPLMRAAKAGDVPMMRLLLEHGADPSPRLKNGTTLFMLAAGTGWRGGFDTNRDPGTEAAAIDAMKLCLEVGADVNAVNANGQAALHGAIGRGPGVIKFLVEHGADVHARDKAGRTPLDLALGARDQDAGADHVGSEVREAAVAILQQLQSPKDDSGAPGR
jgi:ankyrin repeat protein